MTGARGGESMTGGGYPGAPRPARQRLLVIKLGALGDFVHAFHGFAAIRAARPDSHITLLTTAPFRALAETAPWFDEVVVDARPPWWNLPAVWRTVQLIRRYDFVYDLQTSRRTARYFVLAGRPPWSGHVLSGSHPHANPKRDSMHTIERQREQLEAAGISTWPTPARGWLSKAGCCHGVEPPYALLVPGGAGVGAVKRWPVARYAAVAEWLAAQGLTPVVIGGRQEAAMGAAIVAHAPAARDLTGQTTIPDIAALAEAAALALGNDTGPLQLAAAMGAPTVVLLSSATVASQAAPRGPRGEWPTVLQAAELEFLPIETVLAALSAGLQPRPAPPPDPPRVEESTSLRSAAR